MGNPGALIALAAVDLRTIHWLCPSGSSELDRKVRSSASNKMISNLNKYRTGYIYMDLTLHLLSIYQLTTKVDPRETTLTEPAIFLRKRAARAHCHWLKDLTISPILNSVTYSSDSIFKDDAANGSRGRQVRL